MDKSKRTLRFISSWDDGSTFDVRLAELLKQYELPAIFYIPTACDLTVPQLRKLHKDGFEIGGHTTSHPQDIKLLSPDEQYNEIYENKKQLEEWVGIDVEKFCYPRGRYNNATIQAVKRAGMKSARTTKVLQLYTLNEYEEPTTIHVFQRAEYNDTDWLEIAMQYAEHAAGKSDATFHLWGHSWEIERDENWVKLEELFKHLKYNYEIK